MAITKQDYRKWIVLILALLLVATGVDAQKVDQRLVRLMQHEQDTRALIKHPRSPQTDRQQIVVNYNADGTINTIPAIAILEKDAECPTTLLEQMGIEVRFVVGDMVGLVIPADKLMALEQVDAGQAHAHRQRDSQCHQGDQCQRPIHHQSRIDSLRQHGTGWLWQD